MAAQTRKAGEYTPEELREFLSRAFSYENRDKHGCEHLGADYAGTVNDGNKLFDVYLDTGGNAWYQVRFMTDRGPVSEFEYIFGYDEKQIAYRKRAGVRV